MERLGPLSYLVETEDQLLWRRQIDHMKKLDTESSSQPTPIEDSGDWGPSVAVPENRNVTVNDDTPDLPPEPEQPAESEQAVSVPALGPTAPDSSSATTSTPETDGTPTVPVTTRKQYSLRRNRAPPDYLSWKT